MIVTVLFGSVIVAVGRGSRCVAGGAAIVAVVGVNGLLWHLRKRVFVCVQAIQVQVQGILVIAGRISVVIVTAIIAVIIAVVGVTLVSVITVASIFVIVITVIIPRLAIATAIVTIITTIPSSGTIAIRVIV